MVRRLARDLPELLALFAFPRHLWRKLRTTNVIERYFVEVRRRTRPMVCFVNVASVDRIIYSIFQKFNLEWKNRTLKLSHKQLDITGYTSSLTTMNRQSTFAPNSLGVGYLPAGGAGMQTHAAPFARHELEQRTLPSATPLERISPFSFNNSLIGSLQSSIGNRAVQRVIGSGILQRKLTIGSPGDVYEQEAEEVARRVTSSGGLGAMSKCTQPGSSGNQDCSEYDELTKRTPIQRTLSPMLVARVPLNKLHRWYGNRAVVQILRSIAATPAYSSSELRRKCSCGGGSEGECEECRMGRRAVQRAPSAAEADAGSVAPPMVEEVLATPGQPLSASARRNLEPGFGYDFSQVRVHDDAKAAESARAVNAVAYTVGNHIAFADGQYAPGTDAGNHLLAHELTHTIQQTGGTPGSVQRQIEEDETNQAAVTSGQTSAGVAEAPGGSAGGASLSPTTEVAQGGISGAGEVFGPSPVPMTPPTPPPSPSPTPPPAPAGCTPSPAVPFTAANVVLNGPVPGSHALSGCTWGMTFPEAVRATISARCDGTKWFAVLSGLTGEFSQQVRLLPGVKQVTDTNTTQTNFCDQARELDALGLCPGKWYALAAVQAHENVHLARFQPALVAKAPTIEATITSLSVADAPGKTAAKAATEIAALPAFASALTAAEATWVAEAAARIAHDHDAGGPCDTAEHGVVDPIVTSICNKAKANKWTPACATCPP